MWKCQAISFIWEHFHHISLSYKSYISNTYNKLHRKCSLHMTYCLAMIHSWVKYQHKDKIKQYKRTLDNDDVCNDNDKYWIAKETENEWFLCNNGSVKSKRLHLNQLSEYLTCWMSSVCKLCALCSFFEDNLSSPMLRSHDNQSLVISLTYSQFYYASEIRSFIKKRLS